MSLTPVMGCVIGLAARNSIVRTVALTQEMPGSIGSARNPVNPNLSRFRPAKWRQKAVAMRSSLH
jgi:hypothetical protein